MTSPVAPGSLRIPAIDPAWTRLAAAVLGTALLAWTGLEASRRGNARRAEVTRAEALLSDFARLRQQYRPAVAAESISWRRTWGALQSLGVAGDERLALTRSVSRAAESAGLRDVRVLIGPSDTTGLEGRLSSGGIERKPATFSLVIEGRGGMRPVIAFIGALPPSVAVTQVSLARHDERGQNRISLAVYELSYPNGPPPSNLWSSLERGASGGGSVDRPGG